MTLRPLGTVPWIELLSVGFERSRFDPCIYYMRDGHKLVGIYGVHVDDCATGGTGSKYVRLWRSSGVLLNSASGVVVTVISVAPAAATHRIPSSPSPCVKASFLRSCVHSAFLDKGHRVVSLSLKLMKSNAFERSMDVLTGSRRSLDLIWQLKSRFLNSPFRILQWRMRCLPIMPSVVPSSILTCPLFSKQYQLRDLQ